MEKAATAPKQWPPYLIEQAPKQLALGTGRINCCYYAYR